MNEKKQKTNFHYTTNQLAKACGISRSTVLRLEKRGLIMPHERQNSTTSRAYDISDVYKTSILISLQNAGFDNDVISDFLEKGSDYSILKNTLTAKIKELEFLLNTCNELMDTSTHMHVGYGISRNYIAYALPVILKLDDRDNMNYIAPAIDQAIRKGFQLSYLNPPSIILPENCDVLMESEGTTPAIICVPIEKDALPASEKRKVILLSDADTLPDEPCIVEFHFESNMHVSWFGSIEGLGAAFEELKKQIDLAGKAGTGFYYILLFKGDFFDKNISESNNHLRVVRQIK